MWTQNPDDQGKQIYGVTLEMEIKFELEDSDLDCVFEPDFDIPINWTDIEKATWNLQNGTHTRTMANVLSSPSEHEHTTTHILPIV